MREGRVFLGWHGCRVREIDLVQRGYSDSSQAVVSQSQATTSNASQDLVYLSPETQADSVSQMDYELLQTTPLERNDSESDESITANQAKRPKIAHPTQPICLTTTSNKYEALQEVNETSEATQTTEPKKRAPPPIFLRSKARYTELSCGLTSLDIKFNRVVNRRKDVRFHPETEKDYRDLVQLLEKVEIPFHTFELAERKTLKVIL